MRTVGSSDRGIGRRVSVGAAVLVALLLGGAYLLVLAMTGTGAGWLGWFSLVPLFLAIRRCRPLGAALAGVAWGAALFGFSALSPGAPVAPGVSSLLLLTAIPAVYTCLGAWLTRWIGFSPFVLGVGWMGVELALRPVGLDLGLLAGTQSDCAWLAWVGRGLGYVVAAFAVAYVNALLLELLCRMWQ